MELNPKMSDIKLPSDRTFGLFFVTVFLVVSALLTIYKHESIAIIAVTMALLLITVTVWNSDLLRPLNILWMKFGVLIGKVVSPFVLGLIFFGVFTPVALGMRLFGRDELRLSMKPKTSFWRDRKTHLPETDTFKNQF